MGKSRMSKYKGMPDLQEFLIGEGFKLYPGNLGTDRTLQNACNWYACRIVEQEAPPCICNEKAVQIVVKPHAYSFGNGVSTESVTVELSALSNHEDWWELNCYGLSPETLKNSLNSIEERLVAAWKAVNF